MGLTENEKKQLHANIRLNMDIQDKQLFGNREKQRLSIRQEQKRTIVLAVVMVLLFLFGIFFTNDLFLGFHGFSTIVQQLMQRGNDLVDLILGNALSTGIHFHLIMFAAPVLVGMALGSAGACYQGMFHNPMASPTLLGITSGGLLGSAVYMLFFQNLWVVVPAGNYSDLSQAYYSYSVWQLYSHQLFIMAGCFLVVLIVLLIARGAGHGKLSTVGLVVGGTVFSGGITALLNVALYIMTYRDASSALISTIRGQLAGQFTTISSPVTFVFMLLPMVIPMILLFLMANRINLVTFGDDEARAMGVNVERTRLLLIILTTIMTSVTVAFCGQISFVGLMIPQLGRFVVGTDYRYLLPASAFLGGIAMLLAYIVYYSLNFTLSVGAYVNTLGSIIFFIMMIRYRRRGHADWT